MSMNDYSSIEGYQRFDDISEQQGWNAQSRETVILTFLSAHPTGGDLGAWAKSVADTENGIEHGGKIVPDFQMDVSGTYEGRPYPEMADYRVTMTTLESGEDFALVLETSDGSVVNSITLSMEDVDGIQKAAMTDHSLDAYGDDWKFPAGLDREVYWDLGDGENVVRLSEGQITEIRDWLEYATGEKEWNWEDDGEVYEV